MSETIEIVNPPALPGMEDLAELPPDEEARLRSDAMRRIFEAAEDYAPWMDDYWQLQAEGWPWRQAVYMIWASQPADKRAPATQVELATEVLGLKSDRQIRKWRENNPAIGVKIRALTISAVSKARAQVIGALIESASDPNPRSHADRRMLLEMDGSYIPRTKVTVGAEVPDELDNMSEEELRALAYGSGAGKSNE